jgi:hypothetical protein
LKGVQMRFRKTLLVAILVATTALGGLPPAEGA